MARHMGVAIARTAVSRLRYPFCPAHYRIPALDNVGASFARFCPLRLLRLPFRYSLGPSVAFPGNFPLRPRIVSISQCFFPPSTAGFTLFHDASNDNDG